MKVRTNRSIRMLLGWAVAALVVIVSLVIPATASAAVAKTNAPEQSSPLPACTWDVKIIPNRYSWKYSDFTSEQYAILDMQWACIQQDQVGSIVVNEKGAFNNAAITISKRDEPAVTLSTEVVGRQIDMWKLENAAKQHGVALKIVPPSKWKELSLFLLIIGGLLVAFVVFALLIGGAFTLYDRCFPLKDESPSEPEASAHNTE